MESVLTSSRVILITGTSSGIGSYLVKHYLAAGDQVIGCSRTPFRVASENYRHFCLSVHDEPAVKGMFAEIAKTYKRLDVLINNAGIGSMNHVLLTPLRVARNIIDTNFLGTFLLSREAARIMRKHRFGRMVNFATVATPLKLDGEAVYAASKAAVITFTQIVARELAPFGITVNAVGPTPVMTRLIARVPEEKIREVIGRQAIQRLGEFRDISNVVDFFIRPESDFVTGQVIFLGGI